MARLQGIRLAGSLAAATAVAGLSVFGLLRHDREQKSVHCLANLRTIGKAHSLYAADFDGVLPPFSLTGSAGFEDQPEAYVYALSSYGVAKTHFKCPLDGRADGLFWSPTYIVPAHIDPIIEEDGSMEPIHLDSLKPDQPILFDRPWILHDAQGELRRWTEHGEDLTNVLFADGHVEARHPMAKP